MKANWIKLMLIIFLTNSGFSQSNSQLQKLKFTFEDIEQIKSKYLKSLKEENAREIIIYTKWFIGSHLEATTKRESYKNHFDMYVLWRDENRKFNFLQINNLGEKKKKRKGFRRVRKYLKLNFNGMLKEDILSPQTVQIEYEGEMVEIPSPFIDHELEYQIDIFFKGEYLEFKYRPSWKHNKENLEKKKYHLIDKLDNVVSRNSML